MNSVTKLRAARTTSGLYEKEIAEIIGVDLATYREIEIDNDLIRIRELKLLRPHINKVSAYFVRELVDEIFLPFE